MAYREGNISYFPGCEPPKARTKQRSSTGADPVGAHRERLARTQDAVEVISYSRTGGQYVEAVYRYRYRHSGKRVYLTVPFASDGSAGTWRQSGDIRRVRASFRRATHRLMSFSEAFPGLRMNKQDLAVFGQPRGGQQEIQHV